MQLDQLDHGQCLTVRCIDWETTAKLVLQAAATLTA